ncbi:hypothetical protein [Roseobacter sinensis]|uniref:DUF1127 domain-containing protein n=1 Tax=Roseobacter sinensis TaxID=2931391 RepID=A0ABT3BDN5_9RHOB|nr:hypothetical protein [Roseobacter sp. WL0113]MCV3271683.1 hypothetical protein [Roseobacter sp. WL0113]
MTTLSTLTRYFEQRGKRIRWRATRRFLAGLPDHLRRDVGVAATGEPFDPRRRPGP